MKIDKTKIDIIFLIWIDFKTIYTPLTSKALENKFLFVNNNIFFDITMSYFVFLYCKQFL